MKYTFDPVIAKRYGVEGAIIIENLYFWIMKNKANDKNYFDGDYWTYNSVKAFEELFPFWTKRQIERILKNLEKEGAIKTGNYNKSPYDRTKWYALNKMIYSIYANGEMKITKRVNENTQNGEPIPYINTDDKPNYKPDNKKEKGKKKVTELDKIIESYTSNSELIETLQDFLKMRKAQKKSMTDRALKTLLKKLDTIATTDVEKIERLEESICNCWLTVYPKKQYNNSYNNKNYRNEELNTVTKEDYQQLQKEITEQIDFYNKNKEILDPEIDEIDF